MNTEKIESEGKPTLPEDRIEELETDAVDAADLEKISGGELYINRQG